MPLLSFLFFLSSFRLATCFKKSDYKGISIPGTIIFLKFVLNFCPTSYLTNGQNGINLKKKALDMT